MQNAEQTLLNSVTRLTLSEGEEESIGAALQVIEYPQSFITGLEKHALAPLLYHHAGVHDLPLTQELKIGLAALAMRHRAVANARYKVFSDLHARFTDADIPLVALKGLALAPLVYKDDSLRPMRDIDVLVPRSQLDQSAQILRDAGFELPDEQQSRFMRDSHQLPNATKKIEGFTISVEVHHDALPREAAGHLHYEDVSDNLQIVKWRDIEFHALGNEQMLHQLCKHLSGLHPGDYIKQINMLDVVAYAETFMHDIYWAEINTRYSHVINTLKCLHYVVPLSDALKQVIVWSPPADSIPPQGVGTIMLALKRIFSARHSLREKATLVVHPSDWWMHLYYNVDPAKSLLWVKWVRHPLKVASWLIKRAYSGAIGG